QHQPDDILRRPEMLTQIERQQRGQHIEGEEQREVRRHHLAVVSVPEPFHQSDYKFACKVTTKSGKMRNFAPEIKNPAN
ncbi:MAG: hypothetical protein J1E57_12375, partial [Prevotella sp.]|nr:hypothetical protein [Prevotella sp.]